MIRGPPKSPLFPYTTLSRPRLAPALVADGRAGLLRFLLLLLGGRLGRLVVVATATAGERDEHEREDRKSTRLNSSHANISYAVFCLKKKTSAGIAPKPGVRE